MYMVPAVFPLRPSLPRLAVALCRRGTGSEGEPIEIGCAEGVVFHSSCTLLLALSNRSLCSIL
jgi:hypothetical protein